MNKRIAITGMAINTPIGDNTDIFLANLLAGKSAITHWKMEQLVSESPYSKIGGDLSDYDVKSKLASFSGVVSDKVFERLKKLLKRAPWSAKLSMLLAVDAYRDADLERSGYDMHQIASIISGQNIETSYICQSFKVFQKKPNYIFPLTALHSLDTNHASSISEVLQSKGPTYTVGGACASGNIALSNGMDQIRCHGMQAVLIVSPICDFSPMAIHSLALMGAISYKSFNDTPMLASRPYDVNREGFIPSHGGAALVIEDLEMARARGAHIYAEVLAVASNSDSNHLPNPLQDGQAYLMAKLLRENDLMPEQIDYVSAHATSTPLGDVVETRAIKQTFAAHAYHLKINAPKSILGHTCWSAATVETVAAVLQLQAGKLHPSINIEHMDSEVDLDICRETVDCEINILMKDSFGFGGLNSISLLKRYEDGG